MDRDAHVTSPEGEKAASLGWGLFWSFLAAFFAAGYLIPYRYAVEGAPRMSALTAMFTAAAFFNGAVAFGQRPRSLWRVDRVSLLTALLLAFFALIGNWAIARALPDIGAGMTSTVMKAQVILTPILAWLFLDERAPGRLWAGATVALLGFAIPQLIEGRGAHGAIGYAAAFLAALSFAGMQIVTRKVIHRIQAASVNALRLVLAVLVLQLLPEGRAAWTLPAAVWGPAAAAGVLGPGLSRLCLMAAIRHVSPSITALVALVGPVFAFGLGALFFGEAPSTLEVIGAVLILGGVLWPLLPGLFRAKSADSR